MKVYLISDSCPWHLLDEFFFQRRKKIPPAKTWFYEIKMYFLPAKFNFSSGNFTKQMAWASVTFMLQFLVKVYTFISIFEQYTFIQFFGRACLLKYFTTFCVRKYFLHFIFRQCTRLCSCCEMRNPLKELHENKASPLLHTGSFDEFQFYYIVWNSHTLKKNSSYNRCNIIEKCKYVER